MVQYQYQVFASLTVERLTSITINEIAAELVIRLSSSENRRTCDQRVWDYNRSRKLKDQEWIKRNCGRREISHVDSEQSVRFKVGEREWKAAKEVRNRLERESHVL